MKKLSVITKTEAMKMAKANPGLRTEVYCAGKYIWHGSQKPYVGKEHEVSDRVSALWVERRSDSDGPYARFMCLLNDA
jgi:hypothetical protein